MAIFLIFPVQENLPSIGKYLPAQAPWVHSLPGPSAPPAAPGNRWASGRQSLEMPEIGNFCNCPSATQMAPLFQVLRLQRSWRR